jgi:hypothetical protein
VGRGAIIVRDNPGMDLSGLNRDTSKALTEETIRDTSFTLNPLFSRVDQALAVPGLIDEGYKFSNAPGKYINDKWDKFFKEFKKNWKSGGNATQNP